MINIWDKCNNKDRYLRSKMVTKGDMKTYRLETTIITRQKKRGGRLNMKLKIYRREVILC